jgi:uncharacterized protein
MARKLAGILRWFVLLAGVGVFATCLAESVETLPAPKGYVNDFAGILSTDSVTALDQLCAQIDQKAHAQIAVVTVKSMAPDKSGAVPSIEEFAVSLEEKWKVGPKSSDRGLLVIVSLNPRKYRIEVGYGLEGILNDAKVGDIGRDMQPYLRSGDYSHGITVAVQELAQVIAADAGVSLQAPSTGPPGYHYETEPATQISPFALIVGGIVVVVVLAVLVGTGHIGLLFYLLLNLFGGGGRGGYRGGGFGGGGGGDSGGGFGGFGGGSSGGGGASGDF